MALEIEEDLRLQHRLWTAERVGWLMVGVLVLAALAGLFGTGPLSLSSVASPTRRPSSPTTGSAAKGRR